MAVGGLKVLNIDARAPGLCICLHPCIWFRHYVKIALRKAVALLPEHAFVAYTTSRATRVDIMRTRAHRRVNRWTHSCNCLSWRPCFLRVSDPWETLWQRKVEEQVERQRLKKLSYPFYVTFQMNFSYSCWDGTGHRRATQVNFYLLLDGFFCVLSF